VEETGIPRENHRNGSQFYWWRKQEYPEKTTEMSVSFIGGGNRNTQRKQQKWQSVILVEETGIPRENHRILWCSLGIPVSSTNKADCHFCGFLWVFLFPPPIKLTAISVKMAVSCIGGGNRYTQTKPQKWQSVLLVEETGIPRENHRNGSQFYWWRKQEYPE
jgi:hypothetical protein